MSVRWTVPQDRPLVDPYRQTVEPTGAGRLPVTRIPDTVADTLPDSTAIAPTSTPRPAVSTSEPIVEPSVAYQDDEPRVQCPAVISQSLLPSEAANPAVQRRVPSVMVSPPPTAACRCAGAATRSTRTADGSRPPVRSAASASAPGPSTTLTTTCSVRGSTP